MRSLSVLLGSDTQAILVYASSSPWSNGAAGVWPPCMAVGLLCALLCCVVCATAEVNTSVH